MAPRTVSDVKTAPSTHKFKAGSFKERDAAKPWDKAPVFIALFLLGMFIVVTLADALIQ